MTRYDLYTRCSERFSKDLNNIKYFDWTREQRRRVRKVCMKYDMMEFNFSHIEITRVSKKCVKIQSRWSPYPIKTMSIRDFRTLVHNLLILPSVISLSSITAEKELTLLCT